MSYTVPQLVICFKAKLGYTLQKIPLSSETPEWTTVWRKSWKETLMTTILMGKGDARFP